MFGKYRGLLRRRDYLVLLSGNTISRFGDEILYLALLAKVYELTGSALNVGLVTILDILPGIVISPLAGFWIDRLNRKVIMIAAALFSGLVVLGLVWARELWQIYLAMLLVASGAAIFHPANSSLEPNLLAEEQYMLANSLKMTVNNLQRVLGPAAGGAIVGFLGFGPAFFADAATFGASALAILLIRHPGYPKREQQEEREPFFRELTAGLRLLWAKAPLRFIVSFYGLVAFVMAMQGPLVYVFVEEVLHRGPTLAGLLFSTLGIGGILGGLMMGALENRLKDRYRFTLNTLLFDGLILLGFALNRYIPLSLVLFSLLGVIGTVYGVIFSTILQEEVPDELRGRAYGSLEPVFGPLNIISIGLGTSLARWLGVQLVFIGAAIGELVISVASRRLPAYRRARAELSQDQQVP